MRIHTLQHVPFEGLGNFGPYLRERGHTLTHTRLYDDEPLPEIAALDALIVMGGPMNIHDETEYPWLAREKAFIRAWLANRKPLLGICLGAQLIAHCLGAAVIRGRHREIGWFPVTPSADITGTPWADVFTAPFDAFHWHGDTFATPEGAIPLGETEACSNQGFILENRVVGLQFHLETTPDTARDLIKHTADELDGSHYVQTPAEMLESDERFVALNRLGSKLLDLWLS